MCVFLNHIQNIKFKIMKPYAGALKVTFKQFKHLKRHTCDVTLSRGMSRMLEILFLRYWQK